MGALVTGTTSPVSSSIRVAGAAFLRGALALGAAAAAASDVSAASPSAAGAATFLFRFRGAWQIAKRKYPDVSRDPHRTECVKCEPANLLLGLDLVTLLLSVHSILSPGSSSGSSGRRGSSGLSYAGLSLLGLRRSGNLHLDGSSVDLCPKAEKEGFRNRQPV